MREKFVKANKCLHVVITLRQEGTIWRSWIICFNQLLWLIFCMVYRCMEPPLLILTTIHHFSGKCYKRGYISRKLNVRELLERSDCRIFRKALRTNSPLVPEDFTRKEFHQLRAKKTMLLSSYSGNRELQIVLCE